MTTDSTFNGVYLFLTVSPEARNYQKNETLLALHFSAEVSGFGERAERPFCATGDMVLIQRVTSEGPAYVRT